MGCLTEIRTWLTEIQPFKLVEYCDLNSIEHAAENHVLKTINNDLKLDLLNLYQKHSASLRIYKFSYVCQEIFPRCLRNTVDQGSPVSIVTTENRRPYFGRKIFCLHILGPCSKV